MDRREKATSRLDFEAATARISPWIRETPLVETAVAGVLLKCEQRQVTGSFKVRGALNKVLQIPTEALARGIVAASAGNHGLGVAYAARQVGARATIVVPDDAVETKVEGIRSLGGDVVAVPGGFGAAEARGRALASEQDSVWVSPYNDEQVIEGQGTLGLEVDRQLRQMSQSAGDWEIFVPVSGGGLICGVGLSMKGVGEYRVIGVQTQAAPYMAAFLSGESPDEVLETPTLADGLAGPVERNSITFELLHQAADEVQLVSEAELLEAMELAWLSYGLMVEPSAAVPLAAALREGDGRGRVVILSGGNLAPELRTSLASKRPSLDEL